MRACDELGGVRWVGTPLPLDLTRLSCRGKVMDRRRAAAAAAPPPRRERTIVIIARDDDDDDGSRASATKRPSERPYLSN